MAIMNRLKHVNRCLVENMVEVMNADYVVFDRVHPTIPNHR
jgi:hypothetical protein